MPPQERKNNPGFLEHLKLADSATSSAAAVYEYAAAITAFAGESPRDEERDKPTSLPVRLNDTVTEPVRLMAEIAIPASLDPYAWRVRVDEFESGAYGASVFFCFGIARAAVWGREGGGHTVKVDMPEPNLAATWERLGLLPAGFNTPRVIGRVLRTAAYEGKPLDFVKHDGMTLYEAVGPPLGLLTRAVLRGFLGVR